MPNSEPQGWVTTTLEVVADWASGGTPSRSNGAFFNGDIPWIKTGELGPKFIRDAEEKITPEAIEHSAAKIFPKGSVGIAMYGATIGKLSIWGISASTNQACAVATAVPDLLFNEFLFYYLLSQRRGFVEAGKGGAQPNISQGVLKEWPVCLPPFNEQRRIVGKIEELFSELDKGMENWRQARAQLAVYRQALLKHAFEGQLTAAWRETHAAQLESADQLLARIRTVREARYQQQLAEWKKAIDAWQKKSEGTKPLVPIKPDAPNRLAKEIADRMTALPSGWLWLRLDHIAVISGGLTKNPKRESLPKKLKYLRVANVHADRLDLNDVYEIGVTEDEAARVALSKGDLLIVEGNGSIEQIGRVAEWTGSIPDCGHQNHLIRARIEAYALPRFALRFLQSPLGRDAIIKASSSTSGLHTQYFKGWELEHSSHCVCGTGGASRPD